MHKLVVFIVLTYFSATTIAAPKPSYLELVPQAAFVQPALLKTSVVGSVPTSISESSNTVVHSSAPIAVKKIEQPAVILEETPRVFVEPASYLATARVASIPTSISSSSSSVIHNSAIVAARAVPHYQLIRAW